MKKICLIVALMFSTVALAEDNSGMASIPLGAMIVDTGCAIATIDNDDKVLVDWGCVDKTAAKYRNALKSEVETKETGDRETDLILRQSRQQESEIAVFAYVLKSVRDGTATTQPAP